MPSASYRTSRTVFVGDTWEKKTIFYESKPKEDEDGSRYKPIVLDDEERRSRRLEDVDVELSLIHI